MNTIGIASRACPRNGITANQNSHVQAKVMSRKVSTECFWANAFMFYFSLLNFDYSSIKTKGCLNRMLSGFRINQILAKHTSRLQSFSTGQMAGFVECL